MYLWGPVNSPSAPKERPPYISRRDDRRAVWVAQGRLRRRGAAARRAGLGQPLQPSTLHPPRDLRRAPACGTSCARLGLVAHRGPRLACIYQGCFAALYETAPMTMSPGPAEGGGRLFTLPVGRSSRLPLLRHGCQKAGSLKLFSGSQVETYYFFGDGRFSVTVVFGWRAA